MRKLILSISVLALLLVAPRAAQKQEPPHKLVQFQMAVFKKAPKWAATSDAERGRIFQEHLANVISMYESGKMIMAGPFADNTDLVGIFIMRACMDEVTFEVTPTGTTCHLVKRKPVGAPAA